MTRVQEINQCDYREAIYNWNVPCCYMYADPGLLFTPELAFWFEENFKCPFIRYPFFNTVEHMFPVSRPEQFVAAIIDFELWVARQEKK